MSFKLLLFALTLIFSIPLFMGDVFGHGLGGDMAPPINFAGMDVTVSTILNPSDITVGDVNSANIAIRFFDTKTDQNLNAVTYRVEVWRGGELLARNLYYDKDGELNIEVKPKFDCSSIELWKCTTYYGTLDPISGGLTAMGNSRPQIIGPIFDKGGLYNVKVDIEGANSPKTQVAKRLSYETFVSVAHEQNFLIQTAQADVPVVIKTYYDDVSNFAYSKGASSISFEMPFDWTPEYVDLVQVVHEEVRVPKTFSPYKEGTSFKGFVDGVEVDNRALLIDPYSHENENIIHFLVTGAELKRINEKLGPSHYDSRKMFFELVPQGKEQQNSFNVPFDNGYKLVVSWDTKYGAGSEIPFKFTFFNADGNLVKDILYAYSIADSKGNEFWQQIGGVEPVLGIQATEGIDTQPVYLEDEGVYTLYVTLTGEGLSNYEQYIPSSMQFEIGPSGKIFSKPLAEILIPDWVKNNAVWWSEGQIDDKTFANGIQFLIKEEIIRVPITEKGQAKQDIAIPDWVKNNAAWWSEGQIDDKTFANGIQFLIKEGIITV